MARGRKTGERQRGARNRVTAEARAAAEATGIMPLDYMLSVMRDANADPKRRDAMAIAAAPYLHPKVSAVEAKPNEPAAAEVAGIRVVFVRPRPHPEPMMKTVSAHLAVFRRPRGLWANWTALSLPPQINAPTSFLGPARRLLLPHTLPQIILRT
jgi:hypothetical protein